jgi:lipopolysaccharide heptosyltransferase II
VTIDPLFHSINSLLLIKPRAIGDVLLATPVIRNLKGHYPKLQIDFLTEQFAADVLIGNPHLREVLTFNKKIDSTLSIIRRVREKKYDAVIDLFGNPRTALITRFSGAKRRIGFPFRGRAYAYTDHVGPRGGEVHNVDFNLDVLRHFHIPIVSTMPEFPISNVHREFASGWLTEKGILGKTLVGINASGGWYTKKWNPQSFAELADRIAIQHQMTPLFFWGPGEREDVKAIQTMMKTERYLLPKTSLKEMGAFLESCSYLISNDSGPMHIAASLSVPTLGIFGPTNPHLQGPYGEKHRWVRNEALDCLACNLTECPIGNICMKDLTVEAVYSAFKQLLPNSHIDHGKKDNKKEKAGKKTGHSGMQALHRV